MSSVPRLPLLRPMAGRDVDETHRASTPLELLFDLCFVVAVAQAAAALHHELVEGHTGNGIFGFAMGFFGIWWAWMNFTWFASSYDTDDVLYRLAALVQMAGALILAAGIQRAIVDQDFGVVTLGYAVMRLALCASWVRAGRGDPANAPGAYRWAFGMAVCQVGWIGRLALPDSMQVPLFLLLIVAELAVPVWAVRHAAMPWHPGHIAERYGLFTIIVLGESILSATVAFQAALESGNIKDVGTVALGALLTVFAMWWLYFAQPAEVLLADVRAAPTARAAFLWGYGHYFIFGAAAAVGAGVQVVVDQATSDHAAISARGAAAAFAVPVALFLVALWVVHARPNREGAPAAFPTVAAASLAAIALGEHAVLVVGLLMTALVAWLVTRPHASEGSPA